MKIFVYKHIFCFIDNIETPYVIWDIPVKLDSIVFIKKIKETIIQIENEMFELSKQYVTFIQLN